MEDSYTPSAALRAIREQIDHPIVDADGHLLEFPPLVRDYVRDVAGESVARAFDTALVRADHDDGLIAPYRAFFSIPAENTLDRMTATLPSLLYRRLDELGLDYVLLYSTMGFRFMSYPDAEVRTAVARALNTYYAEMYDGLRDRLAAGGVHPDVHPRGSGRRARLLRARVEIEGRDDERVHTEIGTARRQPPLLDRHAGPRQQLRLRSGLAAM